LLQEVHAHLGGGCAAGPLGSPQRLGQAIGSGGHHGLCGSSGWVGELGSGDLLIQVGALLLLRLLLGVIGQSQAQRQLARAVSGAAARASPGSAVAPWPGSVGSSGLAGWPSWEAGGLPSAARRAAAIFCCHCQSNHAPSRAAAQQQGHACCRWRKGKRRCCYGGLTFLSLEPFQHAQQTRSLPAAASSFAGQGRLLRQLKPGALPASLRPWPVLQPGTVTRHHSGAWLPEQESAAKKSGRRPPAEKDRFENLARGPIASRKVSSKTLIVS